MQTHHVDTPALIFAVKFIAVVVLLVVATRIGVETLAYSWFMPDEQEEVTQPLIREPYSVLAGVSRIGSQRTPQEEAMLPQEESPHIDSHIPLEGKFVAIDSAQRVIEVYEDGELIDTLPILGSWREGSHWEAPTGEYAVIHKETNHHSNLGGVSLPYVVHFFGNFYIHGWPYTSDGTPVGESFKGGGIRLASRDAGQLFRFVDIGTPVYVLNMYESVAQRKESLSLSADAEPYVNARAFVLADLETGEVLLAHNEEHRRPIASITKLMTAVAAYETIAFDAAVPLPYKGDRYTAKDLIYPLMLRSDNQVANAYASYIGTDNFMYWMNEKAKAIGMKDTKFQDPSGLSYNNVSTALDLFRLARYLYTETAFILAASKESDKTIYSTSGRRWSMTSQNRFAGDAYFVGGKLGFTDEAQKTGLSVLAVPIDDEVRVVAVVILGSNDWISDTNRLVSWLERSAH